MNKFSIAIPTYNSSIHMRDLLKSLFSSSSNFIIDEIIINDDNSEYEDYKNLEILIDKFSPKHPDTKFQLSRNNINLGGFKNKYITVEKCSNDLIYQIDSDNKVKKNFISFIEKSKLSKNFLYLPSKIHTFSESSKSEKKIKFTRKYGEFTKEQVISFLLKNNKVNKKDLNWVMNIGNPVFYKDSYLEKLEEGLDSNLNLSACSYALTYFWLKNGGSLWLDKKHSHSHRLHDKSYWVMSGNKAVESVNFFRNELISL